MAITGNVALTNTFDEHRIKTNELIAFTNQIESTNIKFISGSSNTLQFSDSTRTLVSEINVRLSNTFTITCNALPQTGGTLTGDVGIGTSFLRSNGMIVLGTTIMYPNGTITLGNTVMFANGMIKVGAYANTIVHANGQINALGS